MADKWTDLEAIRADVRALLELATGVFKDLDERINQAPRSRRGRRRGKTAAEVFAAGVEI